MLADVVSDNPASSTTSLAPIHSLPPELLQKILSYMSPERPSFRSYSYPLCLSQVCSLWRKLVLDMPSLWAQLFIKYSREDKNEAKEELSTRAKEYYGGSSMTRRATYELFALWLERSKPVLVDIEFSHPYQEKDTSFYAPLTDLFIPHSHRIRRLSGVCPETFLSSLPFSKMTSLEDFGLRASKTFGADDISVPSSCIISILGLPRLNWLDLRGIQHSDQSLSSSVFYGKQQLVSLKLELPGPLAARDLLLALPNLKEVDFIIRASDMRPTLRSTPSKRTPLPQLQELAIHLPNIMFDFDGDANSDPGLVLDAFSAPHLKMLDLTLPTADVARSWDALRNLVLASSPCKLHTLMLIGGLSLPEIYMTDILRSIPGLQILRLINMGLDAATLQALTLCERNTSSQLVPCLKELWLPEIGLRLDYERLSVMLRSRAHMLEVVHLRIHGDIPPNILQEIEDCGIPGISVLVYPPILVDDIAENEVAEEGEIESL